MLPPVVVYIPAAVGCWAVGHATGVKDGTWGAMSVGYGGGLVITVLLRLISARAAVPVAIRVQAAVDDLGYARLVAAGGAELLGEDRYGRLWRVRVPDAEELRVIEVLNTTPEPDGSRRRYFLRVAPQLSTPRDAIAWTFGLDGERYAPAVET